MELLSYWQNSGILQVNPQSVTRTSVTDKRTSTPRTWSDCCNCQYFLLMLLRTQCSCSTKTHAITRCTIHMCDKDRNIHQMFRFAWFYLSSYEYHVSVTNTILQLRISLFSVTNITNFPRI